MTGQYDELASCALYYLLPPEAILGPGGKAKAAWIGAGAGIAAWWLESDREYTVAETCNVLFAAMHDLILDTRGEEYVPEDAGQYFLAGFNWMLQFEVPGPGDTVH